MADAMNHNDSKEFVDRASTLDGKSFNSKVLDFFGNNVNGTVSVGSFLEHINSNTSRYQLVRSRIHSSHITHANPIA